MAQAVESLASLGDSHSHAPARSHRALWMLRLALGWMILFAAIVGLLTVSWDIQWHATVGRDRILTAPHLFILGSVTVVGIAAVAAILVETLWEVRAPGNAQISTRFAGTFSSSLGAYIAGFGALDGAIAFPIDQYWHTLYGVDVAIWAPFHIMGIASMSIMVLGAVYMLMSAANLASRGSRAARAAYVGVIVAFAVMMGSLTWLLLPSLGNQGYIILGSVTINVYPFLLGAFGAFTLLTAVRALPWRAAATSVALVYLFFGLVISWMVPPLMTLLVGLEQQTYRPNAPHIVVVAAGWQFLLIVVAILLDFGIWLARRKGWSSTSMNRILSRTALLGFALITLLNPSYIVSVQHHGNVPAILAVSLLLGGLGTSVGSWFGLDTGEAMHNLER